MEGAWFTASTAVQFAAGARCAAAGRTFAVPRTGHENSLLHPARAGGETWLAHRLVGARWVSVD